MLLNELAQWGALIFVGILALGLTRQLGVFLVPAPQEVTLEVGPDVGKCFPSGFLSSVQHAELHADMDRREVDLATFLVVSERCQTCQVLLDELAANRGERLPIVALARESSPEHRQLLDAIASLVVIDPHRLDALNLTIGPLGLVVDRELRVHSKQLVFTVEQLNDMTRSRAPAGPSETTFSAAAPESAPGLAVVTVDGRIS
jgi:hypothetical protein